KVASGSSPSAGLAGSANPLRRGTTLACSATGADAGDGGAAGCVRAWTSGGGAARGSEGASVGCRAGARRMATTATTTARLTRPTTTANTRRTTRTPRASTLFTPSASTRSVVRRGWLAMDGLLYTSALRDAQVVMY